MARPSLPAPVDGNARFIDGRPLVGPSKTIRGIVVSLVVTALGAILLGLHFWIGLLVAGTSMAGDLFSSFLKRRVRLGPSSKATDSISFGIAFSPARLPTPAVLNRNRYRGGLRSLFLRAQYYSRVCFPGWIARPALLMSRLPRHRRRRCKVTSGEQYCARARSLTAPHTGRLPVLSLTAALTLLRR